MVGRHGGRARRYTMVDDPTRSALREALRSLAAQLEWQRDCGAAWLPRIAQPPARGAPLGAPGAPATHGSSPPSAAAARSQNESSARVPPLEGRVSVPPPRPQRTADLFAEPGVRAARTLEGLREHIGD